MKKLFVKISLVIILIPFTGIAQPKFSKISSMPGAFSRIGFGARGIGMGNAMSSIIEGNLVSYYNPALIVYQENNSFQTSYSFLSLDRSLNFLNFTRRFEFYSKKDSLVENPKPRATAGISLGIINAGVGKIDGRDNQGIKTGDLSTSENQFFLGLANKFSDKLSIGVAIKFYYYKLYEKINTNSVGIDIGALYRINDQWNVSLMVSDINSQYKWDTSPVYDLQGSTTQDEFPVLKKIGASYHNKNLGLIVSAEFENSNAETNILRFGAEYNLIENLFVRGGIDQFNLSNADFPPKPALGFSYFKEFGSITFGIDYAFMIEQYSPYDRHIVGLNILFGETAVSEEERSYNKEYFENISRRDSLLKEVKILQVINDSLRAKNIDSQITSCEEEIFEMIGANRNDVNEFRNKIMMIEDKIENKVGNRLEVESKLKEYQKNRISALPEFYTKVHESLPKSLERWKIEKLYEYYVVKKGDSLWKIARQKKVYGQGIKWRIIYDNNRDMIKNPNLIYPNQKLKIIPLN